MSVTKEIGKEEALLITRLINKEFEGSSEVRDKWPVIVMERRGYDEYHNYAKCSLEITFQPWQKPNQLFATIAGNLEIDRDRPISFTDFNPRTCAADPEGKLLLENLTNLVRNVLSKKRKKLLVQAAELNKLAKSGTVT